MTHSAPTTHPPSPRQVLQESQSQFQREAQFQPQRSALFPDPTTAPSEHGQSVAGTTIGTITNAYFTTAPQSRPGSAWNAAPISSTYSMGQALPAADMAADAAASAAPGSVLMNPFQGNTQLPANTANAGSMWPPTLNTVNLWQQQQPSLAARAGPSSPSGQSSSFGAFADSPAQDLSVPGMLGSKRSNSIAAEGGGQSNAGVGFGTGGLFGEGLLSSAASSASSKRHKTAHLSPTSVKHDADSASQNPMFGFATAPSATNPRQGTRNANKTRQSSSEGLQPAKESGEKHRGEAARADLQSKQEKPARGSKAFKSPPRYHFDRYMDVLGCVAA